MTIVLDIQGAKARYQRHRAGHARAGSRPVCRELWAAWLATRRLTVVVGPAGLPVALIDRGPPQSVTIDHG